MSDDSRNCMGHWRRRLKELFASHIEKLKASLDEDAVYERAKREILSSKPLASHLVFLQAEVDALITAEEHTNKAMALVQDDLVALGGDRSPRRTVPSSGQCRGSLPGLVVDRINNAVRARAMKLTSELPEWNEVGRIRKLRDDTLDAVALATRMTQVRRIWLDTHKALGIELPEPLATLAEPDKPAR